VRNRSCAHGQRHEASLDSHSIDPVLLEASRVARRRRGRGSDAEEDSEDEEDRRGEGAQTRICSRPAEPALHRSGSARKRTTTEKRRQMNRNTSSGRDLQDAAQNLVNIATTKKKMLTNFQKLTQKDILVSCIL
jgi:hypothetical protein